MKITADDLARSYRSMSDAALLAMDQDQLTDIARQCLEHEMELRGLTHRDPAAPPAPFEANTEDDSESAVGRLCSAGIFRFADEANALLPALEAAGVAAAVETDTGEVIWSGTTAYDAVRLLVPVEQAEDARGAIENYARAEELAARAHADPVPHTIAARYENGVFTPLEPVELEEGAEVVVELPR
jgi:hypothetical protein